MMISLQEEMSQLIPSGWQKDEFSIYTGEVRYLRRSDSLSEKELNALLMKLSESGIVVTIERKTPWIFLYALRRMPVDLKPSYRIHILLLVLAFITMAMTGADFLGKQVFENPFNLFSGFSYAFALSAILGIHEAGHYVHARRYKLPVSLPYFIPFYIPFMFQLGTFGAFIKMKGQMINRNSLIDVGLYGPIWGFIATLFVLTLGFLTFPGYDGMVAEIAKVHPYPMPEGEGVNIVMGRNLLFYIFQWIFDVNYLPMNEIYHFPLLFAGWIGTFVTALNLLPVGQLDGGHMMYALLGSKARLVGVVFIGLLVVLSFFTGGWVLWVLLLIFMIRVEHPPTMDDEAPLGENQRYLAYFAIAIFILCFIPAPISII